MIVNNKECSKYKFSIHLALDDELPIEEEEEFYQHIESCMSCRKYYLRCQKVDKMFEDAMFDTGIDLTQQINVENLKRLELPPEIEKLILDSVPNKFQAVVIRPEDFPSAAGNGKQLQKIVGDQLLACGLSRDTAIIFDSKEEGLAIRIESNTPISLTLIFLKEEEVLYQVEISEDIPNEVVPLEAIEGWTNIKISRT